MMKGIVKLAKLVDASRKKTIKVEERINLVEEKVEKESDQSIGRVKVEEFNSIKEDVKKLGNDVYIKAAESQRQHSQQRQPDVSATS